VTVAGILVALAASVANAFAVVLQAAEDRRTPLSEGAHALLLAVAKLRLHEQVGPLEVLGGLAIMAGVALVVWAAPRHTVAQPGPGQIALPLVVVGLAAIFAYAVGRLRPRATLALVVGAGLLR
jgi:drug/metabolite transporter (DMT)-like permease